MRPDGCGCPHIAAGAQRRGRRKERRHQTDARQENAEQERVRTMSLTVALLVATLLSQCWSAPQRRNWTPQAILYLKGAQRHRSVLQRTSREEDGAILPVSHKWSANGPEKSKASIFLDFLQRAVEEGAETPNSYTDKWLDNAEYDFFFK